MPSTPKRVLGWTAGQINTAAQSAQKSQRRKAAGRRQQQFLQGGKSHGFWEGRPTDWGQGDPKMGIAHGAASWTQVNPAQPQRLANQGFGKPSRFAGRTAMAAGRGAKRRIGGLFSLESDNDPDEPMVEPEVEEREMLALNPAPRALPVGDRPSQPVDAMAEGPTSPLYRKYADTAIDTTEGGGGFSSMVGGEGGPDYTYTPPRGGMGAKRRRVAGPRDPAKTDSGDLGL